MNRRTRSGSDKINKYFFTSKLTESLPASKRENLVVCIDDFVHFSLIKYAPYSPILPFFGLYLLRFFSLYMNMRIYSRFNTCSKFQIIVW